MRLRQTAQASPRMATASQNQWLFTMLRCRRSLPHALPQAFCSMPLLDGDAIIWSRVAGSRDVLLGMARPEVPDLPVFGICEHPAHELQVALP